VVDPSTGQITGFVVSTGGLFGRDVIVPPQEFASSSEDGKSLQLAIDKDELERRPSYVAEEYTSPPANWIPPAGYLYPTAGFLWPAGGHLSPIGADYPTASPEANAELEDTRRTITVEKGANVLDADGDAIGVVDDVRLDPDSGRLTGLVVLFGGKLQTLFGSGETRHVGEEMIDGVESDGSVRLRVRKEDLRQAA
jgi:sporulation protein YlmC with PRC-barrel domain